MLRHLTVFASDAIARDYTKFTPGALAGVLPRAREMGNPTFLSHDMHRPVGWNQATALYLEPGLARLCGFVEFAAEAAEGERLVSAVRGWYERQLDDRRLDVDRLRTLAAPAVEGQDSVVIGECLSLYNPGVARRLLPKLFALEDDDGLVEVSRLERLGPGVYCAGELAVFAHHYLRRALSPLNSLNAPFLAAFESLDPALRPRVALDPDLVGLAATRRPVIEHEYWWGPKFTDDLASIPSGGARHEASVRERLYHGISRTEFWWQSRKGDHIFEVEELRDRETFGPDQSGFGCRYAHAVVPEAAGTPSHFDGAVRMYSDERMADRLDIGIQDVRRDLPYRKLWRIDGDIPVATWKRLLSDYYRDNHLVGEYLGAPPEARYGEVPNGGPARGPGADAYAGAVPLSSARADGMPALTGPRAVVSVRPPRSVNGEREVVPFRAFGPDDAPEPYVEAQTLNLAKHIRRLGGRITLADDVAVVSPDDLYYNVAPIWHQTAAAVPMTVRALRKLVAAWNARPLDAVVSLALGVPAGDYDVLVALGGPATDLGRLLAAWDRHVQPHFPNVGKVADALAAVLVAWPTSSDALATLATPARNGTLEVAREYLDPNEYTPYIPDGGGGLAVDLSIDVDKRPVVAAGLAAGRLAPRLAWDGEGDRCTRCGGLYRTCACCVWTDPECTVRVAGRPVFAFATDRPA